MTYNPSNQFRCTIIRGKAKTDLDNLLPAYAKIISDVCPADKALFAEQFNQRLGQILPESTEKTLNNHRTEIAGKLFGMFYENEDGIVQMSERTQAFLENNDQPFFFKDICFKFQFPNGMDSGQTLAEKTSQQIALRQFPYILKLLLLAREANIELTKDDIAYYVLNALDVLRGGVSPEDVLRAIASDRTAKIYKKVEEPGKASSYTMQHISEQLNLLELANLIRQAGAAVVLNPRENETVEYFASYWDKSPEFDVYSYDLSDPEQRIAMYAAWDAYYSVLSTDAKSRFFTSIDALEYVSGAPGEQVQRRPQAQSTVEMGDEGEMYVYGYEKERVSNYDQHLVAKVKLLSKTKGLGYDIQSVVAEPGERAEFAKYLEVKATKRVTAPDQNDTSWIDAVNITRNEYIAAQQHATSFFIYRVYFTSGGVVMFVIGDVYRKIQENVIKSVPLLYRLDFQASAVDAAIN